MNVTGYLAGSSLQVAIENKEPAVGVLRLNIGSFEILEDSLLFFVK